MIRTIHFGSRCQPSLLDPAVLPCLISMMSSAPTTSFSALRRERQVSAARRDHLEVVKWLTNIELKLDKILNHIQTPKTSASSELFDIFDDSDETQYAASSEEIDEPKTDDETPAAVVSDHGFDVLDVLHQWQPLPQDHMMSLYCEFPVYRAIAGAAINNAMETAWADNPTNIAPGTRVRVHYGVNSAYGTVLRRGYGRFCNDYRVLMELDGKDTWIDCWRCIAATTV